MLFRSEKVLLTATNNITSYVPHQGVYKENNATTQLRVVFDCAAASKNGFSVNDCFHQGPLLLPQLAGLLLRFRFGRYVVTSDIQKAFHQIEIQEEDRDIVRFLIPKDWNRPIDYNNIQVYRFKRMIFGANCSPSLLGLVIRHHLRKFQNGEELLKNIYVDNLIELGDDKEELQLRCEKTKHIFSLARDRKSVV